MFNLICSCILFITLPIIIFLLLKPCLFFSILLIINCLVNWYHNVGVCTVCALCFCCLCFVYCSLSCFFLCFYVAVYFLLSFLFVWCSLQRLAMMTMFDCYVLGGRFSLTETGRNHTQPYRQTELTS